MKLASAQKPWLALIGLVILAIETGIGVPLHIASYFSGELYGSMGVLFSCGSLIASIIVFPIMILLLINQMERMKAGEKGLKDLRRQPGWLWSRNYWKEHLNVLTPYSPGWLYLITLLIGLYVMVESFVLVYLLITRESTGAPIEPLLLRQTTTPPLLMLSICAPLLISAWRESRITSQHVPSVLGTD